VSYFVFVSCTSLNRLLFLLNVLFIVLDVFVVAGCSCLVAVVLVVVGSFLVVVLVVHVLLVVLVRVVVLVVHVHLCCSSFFSSLLSSTHIQFSNYSVVFFVLFRLPQQITQFYSKGSRWQRQRYAYATQKQV
jgi:hypothetical protein